MLCKLNTVYQTGTALVNNQFLEGSLFAFLEFGQDFTSFQNANMLKTRQTFRNPGQLRNPGQVRNPGRKKQMKRPQVILTKVNTIFTSPAFFSQ